MPKVAPVQRRKAEHLRINLEQDVRSSLTTGLERLHFVHQALPELNLDDVDTSLELFGRQLNAPTSDLLHDRRHAGGRRDQSPPGRGRRGDRHRHRRRLAARRARTSRTGTHLSGPASIAPDVLLFANLGAVQLNYGYGVDECRRGRRDDRGRRADPAPESAAGGRASRRQHEFRTAWRQDRGGVPASSACRSW